MKKTIVQWSKGLAGVRMRCAFAIAIGVIAAVTPVASALATSGLTLVATVAVPAAPRLIAVNSSTHRAYVAVGNSWDNSSYKVSVIEGTTDIADIPVGSGDWSTGPTFVAVNEATNRVYVDHTGSNFVNAIDAGSNSVIGTFGTGAYPEGIVTNPLTNRLYVANTNSGSVSVFDTTGDANTNVATIPVPGAGAGITNLYLAIMPSASRLFVAAPGLGKVFLIDTGSNSIAGNFTTSGSPSLPAVNPGTNELYLILGGDPHVLVLNAATGATIASVAVSGPASGLAVSPTLNHIYVTTPTAGGSAANTLTVIDGVSHTVIATSADLGSPLVSVAADASNGRLYVGTSANTVAVLDDVNSGSTGTYVITASAGTNGSITPSGSVTVNSGAAQTFTISANTGYHVADVLVDGSSVGDVTSYTFSNVTANHTITASFAISSTPTPTSAAPSSSGARSLPDPSSYVMVGSGLAAALLYLGVSRLRRRANRSR